MTDLSVMERVEREEREWREAHAHFGAHGNWLGPDECHTCQGITYPQSPYLRLTNWARDKVGRADYEKLAIRAQSLNCRVGALYSSRHHDWSVSADDGKRRISLRGSGPLAAVLAGLLDDFEAAS